MPVARHHVRSGVPFLVVVGLTVGVAVAADPGPTAASSFRTAYVHLRAGMTASEVAAALGRPPGDYRTAGGDPDAAKSAAEVRWADDEVTVAVTFDPYGGGLKTKALRPRVGPPPTAWDRLTYRLEKRGLRLPRV